MSGFCSKSKSSVNFRRKIAEIQPLLNNHQQQQQQDDDDDNDDVELQQQQQQQHQLMITEKNIRHRIASLDVFRGLSILVSLFYNHLNFL